MSNVLKLWLMGALLSLSVIMAKQLILFGVHPIHLAMIQAFGSIVFLAALGTRGLISSLKSKPAYYLVASLLGFTVPQLIVFYAVEHVGASVAALSYAFPLFLTFFLSLMVSKKTPSVKPLLYMLGAFAGTVLFLYKPDVLDFDDSQLTWLLLLGLTPVALSIANVYRSHHWPQGVPAFQVALLTNVFSLLSYALFAFFVQPRLPDLSGFALSNYATLAGFMLIAALGQLLLFSLQKTATPSFVGQTGSITALTGGVLSFLFFQESYQFTTLIGSLLILFGVAGFSRQQPPKPV